MLEFLLKTTNNSPTVRSSVFLTKHPTTQRNSRPTARHCQHKLRYWITSPVNRVICLNVTLHWMVMHGKKGFEKYTDLSAVLASWTFQSIYMSLLLRCLRGYEWSGSNFNKLPGYNVKAKPCPRLSSFWSQVWQMFLFATQHALESQLHFLFLVFSAVHCPDLSHSFEEKVRANIILSLIIHMASL